MKVYKDHFYLKCLGQDIRDRLLDSALSQKQFAEIVGMQESNLSRLISGKYSPSIEIIRYIYKCLGCDSIPVYTSILS